MSINWLALLPLLVIMFAIIARRDKFPVPSSPLPEEDTFDARASRIAERASRDPSYLPYN